MIRTDIINKIKELLTDNNVGLGFSTFIHYPTVSAREEDIPCLFMYEGPDKVTHKSTRTSLGYPQVRDLDVILEILHTPEFAFSSTKQVRDIILSNSGLYPQASICEKQMEGPMGSGIPNVVVCRLILSAKYKETD